MRDPNLLNAEFTWSNLREEAVCCRLDRFIFTPEWEELFPNVRQITLARVTSDHCPVQLDTSKLKWGPSPFRFENSWLRHPEFKEKLKEWWRQETFQGWEGYKFMKKLKFLKGKIKHWSREKFGEVGKVKEEVKARLIEIDLEEGREGLDIAKRTEREALLLQLEELILKEEVYWRQRAKVQWAKEGDNNTRFFHKVATGRRKRNYIENLELEGGVITEDQEVIEQELINFFINLYKSSNEVQWSLEGINWSPISEEKAAWLERPFDEEEIKRAVLECGIDKSPGPDGFSLAVFQSCWNEVKGDILKVMEEFFQNGIINAITNETYICLIPKKSDSTKLGDFRPISLVSSLYKIVSKVLAFRLREVLEGTISSAQGAFMKGRQILDAVLIANEVVEDVRKKKDEGLVFKIDFEKAYDHVEWAFLDDVLGKKGFGLRWRRWIMGCLSSANFSILINGRPRGKFMASRGLRQGDPLSPFLFTIVVDVLSRLMEKAQELELIKGLVVGRESIEISHLQFADDTIFFLEGFEGSWSHLLELLEFFSTISGLKINKDKCSLVGINSNEEKIERLAHSWGCGVGS